MFSFLISLVDWHVASLVNQSAAVESPATGSCEVGLEKRDSPFQILISSGLGGLNIHVIIISYDMTPKHVVSYNIDINCVNDNYTELILIIPSCEQ